MRFALVGYDFELDGQRVGVLCTGTPAARMKLEDYLSTLVEQDEEKLAALEADVDEAVKLIEEIIDNVAEVEEGLADRLTHAIQGLNP